MTDPNSAAAAPATPPDAGEATVTHGGAHAVAAARRHGVTAMFTLSGGHVFPLYDGAVKADPPMRLVDVRHEQTAVFAAEATARLTRRPGFAVVTAGPGVTNAVSGITTAHPGRRVSLAVASAANTAVCSCRTSTSRIGGSALTAPS